MHRLSAHTLPDAGRLREALRSGLDDLPDADLLDRFARYADHPAFEALLRRHGPLVFGVCRRVLANPVDAEDAFQATFLVLVRKARSVRRGDRVGPWLYGVAYRVAMKARSRAARAAARRTEATDMIPDPTAPAEVPDWLPVLDAELNALPAKYREPLVLCELQGASRADAAKALGVPEGTLSSRLARGRDLLRRRLLKHGTLLPAGGLASLFAAGGVGRAAVPAGLLAKTSELAAVAATGAAPAGAVPAGPARLTDEVLKGMFLTKLRATGGAILAAALVAVGLMAAWPGEAPGQPEKSKVEKATAKATPPAAAQPPGKPVPAGPAIPDRDALQGLWEIEKIDLGKRAKPDELKTIQAAPGKMHILVAGDVWWGLTGGTGGNISPQRVRIDPAKNPKWLDMGEFVPGAPADLNNRCIYELDGDKLRICTCAGENGTRPAEFTTDDDSELIVMHLRRGKMPPAAGEKALVGSWENPFERIGAEEGKVFYTPMQRVEILDGYLFAYTQESGNGGKWIGGRYTVDATKNPKWIDVELVGGIVGDKELTKLHGCYEVADGRLKLAFGTTGKRVYRPLELKPNAADQVLFFDVESTKEPVGVVEKVVREDVVVPAPKPADRTKTKDAPKWDDQVRDLMKAGKFAEAENLLDTRLSVLTGLEAAECRLRYGICLVERAREMEPPKAMKLWQDAGDNFMLVIQVVGEHEKAGRTDKHAAWVRTQAEIRLLQLAHLTGKPDMLLTAAEPLRPKYRGTVEELIILNFIYHAYKQKGESGKALQTRDQMKELFDKLKDKPDAFPAKTGEFSREYWEKVWFAEK
jgi:RNA polymerase sigma factor (sigma-70 family)